MVLSDFLYNRDVSQNNRIRTVYGFWSLFERLHELHGHHNSCNQLAAFLHKQSECSGSVYFQNLQSTTTFENHKEHKSIKKDPIISDIGHSHSKRHFDHPMVQLLDICNSWSTLDERHLQIEMFQCPVWIGKWTLLDWWSSYSYSVL